MEVGGIASVIGKVRKMAPEFLERNGIDQNGDMTLEAITELASTGRHFQTKGRREKRVGQRTRAKVLAAVLRGDLVQHEVVAEEIVLVRGRGRAAGGEAELGAVKVARGDHVMHGDAVVSKRDRREGDRTASGRQRGERRMCQIRYAN